MKKFILLLAVAAFTLGAVSSAEAGQGKHHAKVVKHVKVVKHIAKHHGKHHGKRHVA